MGRSELSAHFNGYIIRCKGKPKTTAIIVLGFVRWLGRKRRGIGQREGERERAMAQYDLTARIAPNLDRHLVFPLLEFLQERQLYPDEEILKSKIELLSKTNMVDYAMDIHKSLYHTEEVPQGLLNSYMLHLRYSESARSLL